MTCPRVPTATVRELAVAASADPRSVRKVLRGEEVRGMADARIRRVLADRGIAPQAPPAHSPADPEVAA